MAKREIKFGVTEKQFESAFNRALEKLLNRKFLFLAFTKTVLCYIIKCLRKGVK